MPRIAVLPDAGNLREGLAPSVLYIEEVSSADFDDEHISMQVLERLEYAVKERLFGEVTG